MGGHLTVTSRENHGSTFTFVLPYKVSTTCSPSDDSDELSDDESADDEMTEGFFQFEPHSFSSLTSSNGSSRIQNSLLHTTGFPSSTKLNGFTEGSFPFPSNNTTPQETSLRDACSTNNATLTSSESQCSSSQMNSNLDNEKSTHGANENQPDTNDRFVNVGVNSLHRSETITQEDTLEKPSNKLQKTDQGKGRTDSSSQCTTSTSSNGSSEATLTLQPRILLVEDNKTNIMVAQSMMKKFGQKIDVVTNGIEAVRAFQRRSYDLILMVCLHFKFTFLYIWTSDNSLETYF